MFEMFDLQAKSSMRPEYHRSGPGLSFKHYSFPRKSFDYPIAI